MDVDLGDSACNIVGSVKLQFTLFPARIGYFGHRLFWPRHVIFIFVLGLSAYILIC
jgi:hypothetical protein